MAVTVRWLLAQRDLGLGLRAGAAATDVPITFVITTELSDPTPWLAGGEMLLTTGIGIPPGDEGCREYVRRLTERGVSALGFGVGVSRESAPSALVAAADEYGLALVDVPLPTPFVAVARTVIDEIARRANRSQVAAGRAQQRMTRAAVAGGPSATLRELAVGCGGTALLLDRSGRVVQAHPVDVDPAVSREVGELARAHRAASAVGPVTAADAVGRATIVTQPIRVGDREHGHLGVVLPHEPLATDHVLIGHANSLLALDFERPLRLLRAQWRINAAALRLVLSAGGDSDEAARLVDEAADPGGVRALVVRGGEAVAVVAAVRAALHDAGRPVFVAEASHGVVVALLGGADGRTFADGLVAGLAPGERARLQSGLGAPHAAGAVADAVRAAELAARAARPGGGTVDASALAGRTLFTDPGTRGALTALDRALLEPLRAQDRDLAQALRAYLENHGQWEGTAAALGVHRHTARARVARAEEVLGVDLKSARVRAELLLALLLGDE
ncbi:PucR family transcriptional regulator [Tsukamurella pseudospumae]|uniref:PucR family transcriptional regulator n=1 Tax=Tsukamurella pseudospumae TaxID=239498 RepID=A0A137ZJE8_9ACTN|nr:PucR family transcriptional regulator [Tsukamurella pseudospumae]KXO98304.1 hypothetical protein AXK61_19970 [Tsukamurella pseudospumae]